MAKRLTFFILLIPLFCFTFVSLWNLPSSEKLTEQSHMLDLETTAKPHSFQTLVCQQDSTINYYMDVFPGRHIPANTPVYTLVQSDKLKKLQEVELAIEHASSKQKSLKKRKVILKNTLKALKKQSKYSRQRIDTQMKLLSLQSANFKRRLSLHQNGHYSQNSLFKEQGHVAQIEAETYKSLMLDKELRSFLNRHRLSLKEIDLEIQKSDTEYLYSKKLKKEMLEEIKKDTFSLPFDAVIEKVFAKQGQSLLSGNQLLSVRSINNEILSCKVPEKFRSHLYQHTLFNSPEAYDAYLPQIQVYEKKGSTKGDLIPAKLFFAGLSFYNPKQPLSSKLYLKAEQDPQQVRSIIPGKEYIISFPKDLLKS